MHLQFLGHPIANDPVYNDEIAWGKCRAKGGVFRGVKALDPADPQKTLVGDQERTTGGFDSPLSLNSSSPAAAEPHGLPAAEVDALPVEDMTIEEDVQVYGRPDPRRARKRARQAQFKEALARKHAANELASLSRKQGGGGPDDDAIIDALGGGSSVPLVPQAVEAILHLRKVRDEEDNFARFRDMDRPPLPAAELPRYDDAGQAPTTSISARRGVRSLSRKERDDLAQQDRLLGEQNNKEETKANPEWYIAQDEKGAFCKVCGLPLLPDPEPRMLEIWLHAIRYRMHWSHPLVYAQANIFEGTEDWDYASPLPEWAQVDWHETESFRRSEYHRTKYSCL